jgi:hypothetical protein
VERYSFGYIMIGSGVYDSNDVMIIVRRPKLSYNQVEISQFSMAFLRQFRWQLGCFNIAEVPR